MKISHINSMHNFKFSLAIIAIFSLAYFRPAYGQYTVLDPFTARDGRVGKLLIVNNSPSSFLEHGSLAGFRYVEQIKKIIFEDLNLEHKNILVLGAGGFTISAAGTKNNNFVYVDIDPGLHAYVRDNFLAQINGDFIAADARQFLQNTRQSFEVIIADTFGEEVNVPSHLLTVEYFKLIEKTLAPDGVAIINLIIQPDLADYYSQRVDNTVRAAFKHCMVNAQSYKHSSDNVLYICSKNRTKSEDLAYTDANPQSPLDIRSMSRGISSNKSPTKP